MTVSRRLLIVALLCLLPSLAAGLFTQFDLRSRRATELGELAMRQAELSSADLRSIIDAARQIGLVASQFPTVGQLNPACQPPLARMHALLPRYAFIAVYAADGRLVCASVPELTATPPAGSLPGGNLPGGAPPSWLAELIAAPGSRVGTFARQPGISVPFLPVSTPLLGADGVRRGSVIVALDLVWLNRRQGALRQGTPHQDSVLSIADAAGTLISRHPDAPPNRPNEQSSRLGTRLDAAELALLRQPTAGFAPITAPDGTALLNAFIPATAQADGLYVGVTLSRHAASAEIDDIALREAVLVGSASLIALILAMGAGEAFIRRPTERLLAAAQRWRVGDLSARVAVREEKSEFGRLGAAFNEMAAALQQRAAEREQQAQMLEAQVIERTRELSESNNRLQVEIAERERTEAALAQAQKLQAVGRLAGGIAHDFNNLLATILGNLELIERRIGPTEERLHALIARATGAVQRGAQLTSRLLTFSRRHRASMRATDVNRLISDLMTLAASTLGQRITVEARLAPDLWQATTDANQVEAAILNLALNARDAMPEGGQLIISTANMTLGQKPGGQKPGGQKAGGQKADAEEPSGQEFGDGAKPAAGDYVRIDVTDTGIGMSEDVMRRAFEPFFTTKGPTGSGLGLSQVYGIAQQAGGTVRLRSAAGLGTTVSLLLPRAPVATADAAPVPARQTLAPGLPVLLVDDDRPVRQSTAEMLRELGCEVLEATTGEEAVGILRTEGQRLGALLVDYAMPGITGLEVALASRNLRLTMPVLLITGYAEFGDPGEPGAELLTEVLRKPFTIRDLEAALARLPAQVSAGN